MTETIDPLIQQALDNLKRLPEVTDFAERAKADALQRTHSLRTNWNAPERHVAKRLGTNPHPWREKLAAVGGRIGKGMMVGLVGGRGTGKTQLAVEVMRESTRHGRSALFTTAMDFFIEIKRTYRKDSEQDERAVLGRYKRRKLLVIDEIGKRSESEWENNLLFTVLNSRYNDVLDTILIDNRSKEDFVATIGPSLADRMNECGGIIECNWPSFRC